MRRSTAGLGLALAFSTTAAAEPLAISNPGFEALYLGSNLPPEYGGDVPAGAFPTGPAPAGWEIYYEGGTPIGGAFIGVLNPGTAADHAPNPAFFPDGAPEGDNAALLYMSGDTGDDEFGLTQQLGATLEADTHYTLSVAVGNIASGAGLVEPFTSFFDLGGFPGYRVQLLAGGVVLAEDAGTLAPDEGAFETSHVELTTGSDPEQVDQPLVIRLVNRNQPDEPGVSGLEVDFDDVQLDASPAIQVPISPAAAVVLGLALALCGVLWIEMRRRR